MFCIHISIPHDILSTSSIHKRGKNENLTPPPYAKKIFPNLGPNVVRTSSTFWTSWGLGVRWVGGWGQV